MDGCERHSARRHCPIVVCALLMLLIQEPNRHPYPETSGAPGSGGQFKRSDFDLGGCFGEAVIP
jgi:hypothetical protein